MLQGIAYHKYELQSICYLSHWIHDYAIEYDLHHITSIICHQGPAVHFVLSFLPMSFIFQIVIIVFLLDG